MAEEAIAVEIRAKRTAGEVVVRVQRSPLSPHTEATRLATAFLDLFPPPRRFLTSFPDIATLQAGRPTARVVAYSRVPVAAATFDAALFVIGSGMIGLVCVADED